MTYQQLQPLYMREAQRVWEKREQPIELKTILEQTCVEGKGGLWNVPDTKNEAHLEQLRHRALMKEFLQYRDGKGKLKVVRTEALRAGFKDCWQKQDYRAIVQMAKMVPEVVIQEDQALLMYYDNPMKIEQRIGRVDRIGQKFPVKAFNLIFEDSVELRVQEVLEEKLATILEEFGVDKTEDVLDSAENGAIFEKLYAQAILNPGDIEKNIDKLIRDFREQAKQEVAGRSFYGETILDPTLAQQLSSHPLPFWVERMSDIPPPFPGADPCPQCASKGIVSYLRIRYDPQPERLGCVRYPACRFEMFFEYYGHEMLVEETEQLLQSGKTDVIEGFQSKEGRPFSARLILGESTRWRVRPLFDNE